MTTHDDAAGLGPAWRSTQVRGLLEFGAGSLLPDGGAGWLDDDGGLDPAQPVHTWITSRMAHTFALGALLGVDGSTDRAARALAGLTGVLHDDAHGGWYAARGVPGAGESGTDDGTKAAYAHAFVVLAASTGSVAGIPGARELLAEALTTLDERFWEADPGLLLDAWDEGFTTASDYRGVNANMHGVEAMLAAYDATDDARWLDRAAGVGDRVVAWAEGNDWRIPEHFTATWEPDLEHHADQPDDQFTPYGATPGHGFEWARLLLQTDVAAGTPGRRTDAAVALFERALADGWDAEHGGFVYTTDWSGTPVVARRFHWVAAEAVAAASVLATVTGEERYAALVDAWWAWIDAVLVDAERGSWRHELDADNQPAADVWRGKPDVYHAVQALLVADLPLRGSFAASARDGAGAWD
ncbi:mannose/cellobiose epimerase-like protein (N-acyl-D-glucosamine 2-epimerase family) [Sediminihabitans luteus]|uniref:Mannose/cellobiose epimerase-like protein (N-acyl-D-glucosamine 2-epimerase family) n=1 Tax=Sediminihabitans luteus TaxID=1138585 RepID=A0A2M9CF08_9CELL|nr:AGE family epimerase/isomerase [Sediminihabitans luteus]PJJ70469.1 mannose/cellobiose epimerase-like protein (N-acyl-D-glucosamine 2-epimerase family) [Sediminihabitans luteus]GII97942.1 N-acyl-D-glucosamine 2-epimerase [Sediminihabitans luteus]